MRSDTEAEALEDIRYHLDLVRVWIGTAEFEAFGDDLRTVYAVSPCLEIISEASRRLPPELNARHPGIAWHKMAAAGNVYRHDYEEIAAQRIWLTVQDALPPSRKVIEAELR